MENTKHLITIARWSLKIAIVGDVSKLHNLRTYLHNCRLSNWPQTICGSVFQIQIIVSFFLILHDAIFYDILIVTPCIIKRSKFFCSYAFVIALEFSPLYRCRLEYIPNYIFLFIQDKSHEL